MQSRAREIGTPEFSSWVRLVYEGTLGSGAWLQFLKELCSELQGHTAVIVLRMPKLGERPLIVTYGGAPEQQASYFERYMAMDPFAELPDGRVFTLHDYVGSAALERTTYYREWLVPIDAVYTLGVDIRVTGACHMRLRVCRSSRMGDFSAADRDLVQAFVPHLRTAFTIFSELDRVRAERSVYAEAMGDMTIATLVVDEACRILHANQLAEKILGENDGLRREDGVLRLTDAAAERQLARLVLQAAGKPDATRPGVVEAMRVARAAGRSDVGLVIRPMRLGIGPPDEQLRASVAIFLSAEERPVRERELSVKALQKLFSFTPREAALAAHLARGETIQEAAAALGITPNTARTQLRSIFGKTGVDRQARLVRILLRSAASLVH